MTKFESIRRDALYLIDAPNCPETAKDMLIKMVADEMSLVHCVEAIAMLNISSTNFRDFIQKANREMALMLLKTLLKEKDGE